MNIIAFETTRPNEQKQGLLLHSTPEFIRLPRPRERCPYCGLTRAALNELVLPTPRNSYKPPVKSFCLRQRGARTGIRLVSYDSLRAYIMKHVEPCLEEEVQGLEEEHQA
jgi:hypothetical protein